MAGNRRRVRGDRSFRKILRRLPESMKAEMLELMDSAGDELLAAMRSDVPSRTGALRSGLSKKVLKASMRLRVGFIGTAVNRRLYYRWIVERGRKAQTVTARRGGRSYSMRISAMAPRPYVFTRRTSVRAAIEKRVNKFWNEALSKASEGATDD